MKLVQCWDDGVSDDIRLIEILRRHGAKASFNINFATHPEQRSTGWKYRDVKEVWKLGRHELKSVYEGFLVANHSLTHPHLDRIAPAEAEREIREGRDALEQHFGYAVTGFAYPFGSYDATVQQLVRQSGHVYARTVQTSEKVFPPEDASAFHPSCHFLAPDFWERFKTANAQDGVFYFWGHSYEIIMEEDWVAFEDKIARLSSDDAARWVDLPQLFERA